MADRVVISKLDVKDGQIIVWVWASLVVLGCAGFLFFSFSWNGLIFSVIATAIFVVVLRAGANTWNVYYEDGFLHIGNLYTEKRVPISRFLKIKLTNGLTGYTLYLDNEESYRFMIGIGSDPKLFFKWDRQFHAKEMTQILNELKSTNTSNQGQ